MKNLFLLSIMCCMYTTMAFAQYFPVDTAKLNSAYRDLVNNPNTMERQIAFFEAFPSTWQEYIMTYQYIPDKGYDLSMYMIASEHVRALGGRVNSINDTVYCGKLVNLAVGAQYDADAPSYLRELLHDVMWRYRHMDVMLYCISELRKGHQMQFWQFYWGNIVKSKGLEVEFNRLKKLNADTYPELMETMSIAYEYFYDGIDMKESFPQKNKQYRFPGRVFKFKKEI